MKIDYIAARQSILELLDSVKHYQKLIVPNSKTGGIVYTIESAFPEAVALTKNIAPLFKRDTDLKTVEAVWKFERKQIEYKKDAKGRQDIRLPNRFLWENVFGDGGGDCKSYSVFAAAILCNLGFDVAFEYAMYSLPRSFSHVYCVCKKNNIEYICDGVYSVFNERKKPFIKIKTHYMDTYILGEISDDQIESAMQKVVLEYMNKPEFKRLPSNIQKLRLVNLKKEIQKKVSARLDAHATMNDEIGAPLPAGDGEMIDEFYIAKKLSKEEKKAKRKKIAQGAKKFFSKLGHGFMFVNLLPIRAAFNAIVAANFNSLAHNLRYVYQNRNTTTKKEWEKIKKVWYNVGGIEKALLKAIELGAKHKPLFLSKKAKARFEDKKKNVKGYAGIGEAEIAAAPAIAAAAAAAAGIIAAILPPIMNAFKKNGKTAEVQEVAEQGKELLAEDKQSGNNFQAIAPPPGTPAINETEAGENEEEASEASTDGLGEFDFNQIVGPLSNLATVGIQAAAAGIKKKASKNPKLKKFLDNAAQNPQAEQQAVQNYTGVVTNRKGATKNSSSSGNMIKYALIGLAGVTVLGVAFVALKK